MLQIGKDLPFIVYPDSKFMISSISEEIPWPTNMNITSRHCTQSYSIHDRPLVSRLSILHLQHKCFFALVGEHDGLSNVHEQEGL